MVLRDEHAVDDSALKSPDKEGGLTMSSKRSSNQFNGQWKSVKAIRRGSVVKQTLRKIGNRKAVVRRTWNNLPCDPITLETFRRGIARMHKLALEEEQLNIKWIEGVE